MVPQGSQVDGQPELASTSLQFCKEGKLVPCQYLQTPVPVLVALFANTKGVRAVFDPDLGSWGCSDQCPIEVDLSMSGLRLDGEEAVSVTSGDGRCQGRRLP